MSTNLTNKQLIAALRALINTACVYNDASEANAQLAAVKMNATLKQMAALIDGNTPPVRKSRYMTGAT